MSVPSQALTAVTSALAVAMACTACRYRRIAKSRPPGAPPPTREVSELAQELETKEVQLQHALAAAQSAREHAERASQAKTDFLALISHELMTPMTSMLLTAQMLQKDPGAAAGKQLAERLINSTKRLKNLIESLRDYSRLDRGRLDLHVELLSPRRIVSDVLDELEPLARQKRLSFEIECANDIPNVESDARLIRMILSNLIDNALKYTERGGVKLRADAGDHHVVFSVHDTGPGISSEQHARIFEPAPATELSKKTTPGTGLGLAIVCRLAQVLGAELKLESQAGHGSRFEVKLPLTWTKT